jgi:hypothetical protein
MTNTTLFEYYRRAWSGHNLQRLVFDALYDKALCGDYYTVTKK